MAIDFADEEFLAFVEFLQQYHVKYMLIGGMAMNYHGVVRSTQDMDIWLEPTNQNRDKFCEVLLKLGYQEDEIVDISNYDFSQPFVSSVWLNETLKVDCLTRVHYKLDFHVLQERALQWEIKKEVFIQVVNSNDLREMKVLSRRAKDLYDVARLDELAKIKRQNDIT